MPRKAKLPSPVDHELPDFLRAPASRSQPTGYPPERPPERADDEDEAAGDPVVDDPTVPPDSELSGRTSLIPPDELRIGDLQASTPRPEEPLESYPTLTHILPTNDPDIDEMPVYAPGQPQLNRVLAEEDTWSPDVSGSHQEGGFGDLPARGVTPDSVETSSLPAEDPNEVSQRGRAELAEALRAEALVVRYVARVEIREAWQFNANLAAAPSWVDRNWLAWDDGAAVRVVRPDGSLIGVARVGDWIVRQNTSVDGPDGDAIKVMDQMAVIPGPEFARLYRIERAEPVARGRGRGREPA